MHYVRGLLLLRTRRGGVTTITITARSVTIGVSTNTTTTNISSSSSSVDTVKQVRIGAREDVNAIRLGLHSRHIAARSFCLLHTDAAHHSLLLAAPNMLRYPSEGPAINDLL
jgi:hypothetical protein